MLLMPQKDWQWRYNDTYGVLSVSLGMEMEFLTPYRAKSLIPDALFQSEFSIEHARFYIELLDRLPRVLSVTDAAIVQTALNATAAHFMLKPQMPKSWFFDVSDVCVYSEAGKLFELKCRGERALVLVVENSLQATLVMLLSKELTLSDAKILSQFETIKIMHNRLHPLRVKKHIVAA
ncbi:MULTISPECIES: cell division protein ZapC [Shewanella]|uniref:Cell division protein ZapC n=1 Tax=Shewanella salipaludis TaxID=2723052 RepID=A0A972FQB5_9GAMM|nr:MULTISPECIES: cell division protein ZapC [Shewanella]MCE9684728.1 cell division protein ZapC [Shewanella sp. AS16]NMH64188.1 cell division protein ZapC [Shewanella salipaludis]